MPHFALQARFLSLLRLSSPHQGLANPPKLPRNSSRSKGSHSSHGMGCCAMQPNDSLPTKALKATGWAIGGAALLIGMVAAAAAVVIGPCLMLTFKGVLESMPSGEGGGGPTVNPQAAAAAEHERILRAMQIAERQKKIDMECRIKAGYIN